MTKSRDTADSINRIDSSAADATAITIDSSENVLVGTTDTNPSNNGASGDAGVAIGNIGYIAAARSSESVGLFNRMDSDGDILLLRKDGSDVGSIKSYNGSFLQIESSGNQSGLLFGTSAYYPVKNGSLDNGNIDLGNGSYRFKDLYLSGGAYIGGTGSANKLDDYEEGTWTPTAGNGFTGLTFDSGTCQYTKVGNVVHVWGEIYSFTGTSSAIWQLSGLPFVINKETAFNVMFQNINLDSGYTGVSGYCLENTDDIRLYETGDNIGWGNVLGNQTGSSTNLIFCLTYLV